MTRNDARYEEVLERRAKALAQADAEEHRRELDTIAALVAIGPESFGIPVSDLREIVTTPLIARLPNLPPWMPGVVQIRGELISVIDTARWFGIAAGSTATYLAVIDGPKGPLGLLVDAVLGFREVFADEIATTFSRDETSRGRPIRAITKDLVALVDVERLLSSDLIVVDNSARPAGQDPVPDQPARGVAQQ